jgi:hypothetical protein
VDKTPEEIADEILAKAGIGKSPRKKSRRDNGPDGVRLEDFVAYLPQHSYIFMPSRELWPAASVNARVPPVFGPDGRTIPAATWLDAHAAVEQMT